MTVDTTFQEGWYLRGQAAVPTAEVTIMFPVGAAGGVVRFGPWGLAKLGYAISTGAFVVAAAVGSLGLRVCCMVVTSAMPLKSLGLAWIRSPVTRSSA